MKHNAYRPAGDQGFTLIEIIITIVILGGVSLMLLPFFNAVTHGPDPVIRERAISLGQAMMDEIMAKKWDANTPMGGGPICTTGESGTGRGNGTYTLTCPDTSAENKNASSSLGPDGTETRIDYDDVDDYNGLNETDTFTDQDGATTTLTGYRRQVTVRYIASNANPIDQNTPAAAGTTDTKLVVVTVTSPLGETFYFVAVACNI